MSKKAKHVWNNVNTQKGRSAVSNINIDIAGVRVFIMFILSTLQLDETISVIERAVQTEEVGMDTR